MKRTSPEWGRVPADILLSGWLAATGADRTELLVLFSIAAHADERFSSFPSMATLARCAGVTERTARRAVRRLEERGVIHVDPGGGRWRSNTYTINADALDDRVSVEKPGRPRRPGNDKETRTFEAQNPDVLAPLPGRPECPPNSRTEEQQQEPAAAAGEVLPPDPIADAMRGAGLSLNGRTQAITDKAREAWGDDAPKRIKAIAQAATGRGKGAGVVVAELETQTAQAIDRRQAKEQRKATAPSMPSAGLTPEQAEREQVKALAAVGWRRIRLAIRALDLHRRPRLRTNGVFRLEVLRAAEEVSTLEPTP